MKQRRSRDGQYDYENMDVLCRCGHRVGDHYAEKPRPCCDDDCGCVTFRRAAPSTRQHERQATRDDGGRYSEMERCELCCGPIRGGDYYSDERCNRLGRGLVLHQRCGQKVKKMSDQEMVETLRQRT